MHVTSERRKTGMHDLHGIGILSRLHYTDLSNCMITRRKGRRDAGQALYKHVTELGDGRERKHDWDEEEWERESDIWVKVYATLRRWSRSMPVHCTIPVANNKTILWLLWYRLLALIQNIQTDHANKSEGLVVSMDEWKGHGCSAYNCCTI